MAQARLGIGIVGFGFIGSELFRYLGSDKEYKHPYIERFYTQQRDAAVVYRDLVEELALTADHALQWLANRLEQCVVRSVASRGTAFEAIGGGQRLRPSKSCASISVLWQHIAQETVEHSLPDCP